MGASPPSSLLGPTAHLRCSFPEDKLSSPLPPHRAPSSFLAVDMVTGGGKGGKGGDAASGLSSTRDSCRESGLRDAGLERSGSEAPRTSWVKERLSLPPSGPFFTSWGHAPLPTRDTRESRVSSAGCGSPRMRHRLPHARVFTATPSGVTGSEWGSSAPSGETAGQPREGGNRTGLGNVSQDDYLRGGQPGSCSCGSLTALR